MPFIRIFAIGALTAAAFVAGAGASTAVESRSYNLSGFTAVSSSAGVTVRLSQGPFSIRAEEAQGRFDKLKITQRDSTLIVSRENTWFGHSNHRYVVYVSAPDLRALEASSGSTLTAEVNARNIRLSAHSGATLRVSGVCAEIDADASSGATLDARDLKCRTADIHSSSGGNVRAFADTEARGRANSGGSVTVHGNPRIVDRGSSSGGSVRIGA